MTIPDRAPTRTRPGWRELLLEAGGALPVALFGAVAAGTAAQLAGDALAGTQGFQDIVRMLLGGIAGLVVAAPVGVRLTAGILRLRGSLPRSLAGSLAGALSVIAVAPLAGSTGAAGLWAVVPVLTVAGAVLGFHAPGRARQRTTDPGPSESSDGS